MGARRRAGDPGLPPAQDSEGERVLGVEGWMKTGNRSSHCASAPSSSFRPVSPSLEHRAVPPQPSAEEPSHFSCRPLPGLEPVPGDLADRR